MEQESLTPHRVIAARVRQLRRQHGWSAEQLAREMTRVGVPWERMVVTKLETGRRQSVTVVEFLALAYVLSVAPVHLLVPIDAQEVDPYQVLPEGPPFGAWGVRAWIRGQTPIAMVDARRYFSEVPEVEWQPPAHQWTPKNIAAQSDALQRVRDRQRSRGDDGQRQ